MLVIPLHPLSKLLAIQDHAQNLGEHLGMEGRREVCIISHRPVTRSDLKQERLFFLRSVSLFLQLVVARQISKTKRRNETSKRRNDEKTRGNGDIKKIGGQGDGTQQRSEKKNDETTKRTFCPRVDFIKF